MFTEGIVVMQAEKLKCQSAVSLKAAETGTM